MAWKECYVQLKEFIRVIMWEKKNELIKKNHSVCSSTPVSRGKRVIAGSISKNAFVNMDI